MCSSDLVNKLAGSCLQHGERRLTVSGIFHVRFCRFDWSNHKLTCSSPLWVHDSLNSNRDGNNVIMAFLPCHKGDDGSRVADDRTVVPCWHRALLSSSNRCPPKLARFRRPETTASNLAMNSSIPYAMMAASRLTLQIRLD